MRNIERIAQEVKRYARKPAHQYSLYAILVLGFACMVIVWANGAVTEAQNITQQIPKRQEVNVEAIKQGQSLCGLKDVVCPNENTKTIKVTAFSSVECHTTWCRANEGKPRGLKIALNPKFGKARSVTIPAYGKTYQVIGRTDEKTDVDIWFGDDGQGAKEHGVKHLEVIINK